MALNTYICSTAHSVCVCVCLQSRVTLGDNGTTDTHSLMRSGKGRCPTRWVLFGLFLSLRRI